MQPAIALSWLSRGRTPIPLMPRSKKAAIPWLHWQHSLPSEGRILGWFTKRPDYNLGLLCSPTAVVLDFDELLPAVQWRSRNPLLSNTYAVKTSRGIHFYLNVDRPVSTNMKSEAVQLKASGYVVGEYSRHESGSIYRCLSEQRRILTVDTDRLLASLEPYGVTLTAPEKVGAIARVVTMGKSMLSMVDDIRANISIMELLRQYTTPKKSSRDEQWFIMRCPNALHQDKHPSFWANQYQNKCGCMTPRCQHTQPGGGKSMDVVNLYGWLNGLTNGDAVRELWTMLHGDEREILKFNRTWRMG
jgi:hypothetical protein